MQTMRKASGFIAAVIVFLMGLGFMAVSPSPSPIVSAGLLVLGGLGMVWQGRKLYQERRDPYDLSRLWDRDDEPTEPEDDGLDATDGTVFCHNCGHSVPPPFARCPQCGLQLR